MLFDFPNASVSICKNMQELDEIIDRENYISVPFRLENGIPIVNIETDFGNQRVILDSGASFCCFRDTIKSDRGTDGKKYVSSRKLKIQDCNFGDWSFALIDLWDQLGVDGCLGVDFFLEHAVCFDFPNQMVYIKKPNGWLGNQWKRGKLRLMRFFYQHFFNLPTVEGL